MLKRALLACLVLAFAPLALGQTPLPAPVLTVKTGSTITLKWAAPTQNTDGSAISAALTYNLYSVTPTGSTLLQSGITSTSNQRTNLNAGNPCYALTAVANTVESNPTTPLCVLVTSAPNSPSNVTVTITLTATSP